MESEKRKLGNKQYKTPDLILLAFKLAPVQSAIWTLEMVVSGLLVGGGVFVTARFIDKALLVASGQAAFGEVVPLILLVLGIIAYQQIIWSVMGFLRVSLENKLRRICKAELTEFRAKLDYRHIENQETQDLIKRVCEEPEKKLLAMLQDTLGVASIAVRLISYFVVIVMHAWWIVVILPIFCVPIFFMAYFGGKKNYEAQRDTTKLDREAKNFSDILYSRENIDERYVYGYVDEVNRRYTEAFERGRIHRKGVQKKSYLSMKTGSVALVLATSVSAIPLIFAAIRGDITIGLFSSLIPSINTFSNEFSWSLSYNLRQVTQHREYLKDMNKFFALELAKDADVMPASPPPVFESLEFKDVGFAYPGTDKQILKGMSFRLERGRHYSIVGENGAGKTTITKLVTGLYTQYDGEILLNGRELRTYSAAEIKALSAVVYQDFARYSITLGENIALGDINALERDSEKILTDKNGRTRFDDSTKTTETGRKLSEAAALLGLDETVGKLPTGYDSPLGKINEDGTDLSGGEWQRVAMARAVVSPAPLKILDEPTAALDPISESRVYREFEKISGGGTTIFISHRLGSTKLADTILVVGDGGIAESGTHTELMAKGGLYSEMYAAQAEWYVENGEGAAV